MKGRFVLSDDSHGTKQIGHSYDKLLDYVERLGINQVTIFEMSKVTKDERFPGIGTRGVSVHNLRKHAFWSHDTPRGHTAIESGP